MAVHLMKGNQYMKKISSKILVITILFLSMLNVKAETTWRLYVGGYNTTENFGINYYSFDEHSNELQPLGLAVATDNPSYLVTDKKGNYLYSVNETAAFDGCGTISAFSIDKTTGKLTEISKESTHGTYPCHLTLNKNSTRLVAANYGSGSIIVFPINKKTGKLESFTAFFQYEGSSINKGRQEGPHAHSVNYDPLYRYLYCCDLGCDKISIYKSNRTGIPLTSSSTPFVKSAEAGAGPRSMAFHPHKNFVYVVNELNNTISLYTASFDTFLWRVIKKDTYHKDGKLEFVASWDTLPTEFDGKNTASCVRIHPNGKYLYVSNRGHDSIAMFSIDCKTGKLNPKGFVPTGGKTPRDFSIHPNGKTLVIANQDSNNLTVFTIDSRSGEIKQNSQASVTIPQPTCVTFVPTK